MNVSLASHNRAKRISKNLQRRFYRVLCQSNKYTMCDLGWLTCDSGNGMFYKNIILVFEHWSNVGKGFFSNSQKLREEILEDFMEEEGIFSILVIEDEDFIWVDDTPSYAEDYEPAFKVFNIYLIP